VFYEKSPRNITRERASEVVRALPTNVEKVGVFVDEDRGHVEATAQNVGLSAVQLHVSKKSKVAKEACTEPLLSFKQYIAVPARTFLNEDGQFDSIVISRRSVNGTKVDAVFLDSGTKMQPGGTGETFDWQAALTIVESIKDAGWNLVVAGGLTPENVSEAISILHPWGVDVSSGVEAKPGKKDPEKVRAFIKAVREADKANSRN
jgi:phosphoribosylanthranilate isomerase